MLASQFRFVSFLFPSLRHQLQNRQQGETLMFGSSLVLATNSRFDDGDYSSSCTVIACLSQSRTKPCTYLLIPQFYSSSNLLVGADRCWMESSYCFKGALQYDYRIGRNTWINNKLYRHCGSLLHMSVLNHSCYIVAGWVCGILVDLKNTSYTLIMRLILIL